MDCETKEELGQMGQEVPLPASRDLDRNYRLEATCDALQVRSTSMPRLSVFIKSC